jgi:phosphoglycolate phosphatase
MNHTRVYSTMLFDLDGTLTDPAEGITHSIVYALECMQAPVPPIAQLRTWIGPPLRDTFAAHLHSRERAEHALALYRERFAEVGIYENVLYPGIPALLARLQAQGCHLFLATAKPLPFAQRILGHFALAPFFDGVAGATLDGSINTKTDVLTALLPQLGTDERAACVMVGDRDQDVQAAHAHDLPCIAVSYGYGSVEELAACEPEYLVHSVDELAAVLLSGQSYAQKTESE